MDSTSDERIANNAVRFKYRELTETDKADVFAIKNAGALFLEVVEGIGGSRELSLANTKIEEAVFWAVKHVTR